MIRMRAVGGPRQTHDPRKSMHRRADVRLAKLGHCC